MSNDHTPISHPDRFFIGGTWVEPSTSSTIQVTHSATGRPFMTVAQAQEADVRRAANAARVAFDQGPWPRMSPQERAVYIDRMATELGKLAEQNALCWTVESGALHKVTMPSAKGLGDAYRTYAKMADTFPFVEKHPSRSGGNVALLVREPVGVVLAIVPWNSPMSTLTKKVGPALLAGCTVIVKSSPEAPGAGYLLAQACEAAGLPPGVLNVVTADRAASELLVRDPAVDKVTFTGSTAAGRRIGAICGERVARCTLELGGKSPAVVLDDYDLDKVAQVMAARTTFLTGQACAAVTRVIVSGPRHDALVEALVERFRQLRVGDPFDPSVDMGPLATRRQLERVQGYIDKGKAEGATLAIGGGRPTTPAECSGGWFVEPTVFAGVDNCSTIAQEEIFGPVLSVIPARDEDHAIELANDTIYGLNASVYTADPERAYAVARRIRSGNVGHNEWRPEFNLAFGGFKQSGIGREGGVEGFHSYLETKVVVLDAVPDSVASQLDRQARVPA